MGENMIRRMLALSPVVFTSLSLISIAPALADEVKLPPSMAMTAYDTGTAGFNITVGVGKMMKDKYGSDVRVLPAGNDVARLAPLRAKRAVASAMGSGTYFAQEGVFEFGVKDWGPQQLQLILSSVDCNGASLGVAADTGVKELKDLKGKRVGFVVGSPALNQNSLAVLAFAGLTQNDVKVASNSQATARCGKALSTTIRMRHLPPPSPAPPRKPRRRRAASSGLRCPRTIRRDGSG
jgi:TRAP transporter TAXI family solute receptor